MVTRGYAGHVGPYFRDNARSLVTHYQRYAARPVTHTGVQIAATHASGRDLNPNLTRLWPFELNILDPKGFRGA